MGTAVNWEGNIGSDPEYRKIQKGNNEPRHLLRLNVYFDRSIRLADGSFEDRGGFWANVEWWHRDAESYSNLFQKGMRVLVDGVAVMDRWKDTNGLEQAAMKLEASRVGILPHRLVSVELGQSSGNGQARQNAAQQQAPAPQPADDFDDEIPY
ncbi:single-stranded DNA-binding protein [Pseudomonas oryzihabitans]|uniref:single-stranded DNA-binding protein n=1 Tax=Pseudomonas oryzihabitans TaxID=47885 RepID=UPI0028639D20|nr:single-stranded DNA-binding protein [Pseudomonas psychrotolerans]MDR6680245.1 single-strand DNA-binding protein [Pseudomonas psychrotolerans]